jgi:N-acetylmuramoyl-L-alanine amidase
MSVKPPSRHLPFQARFGALLAALALAAPGAASAFTTVIIDPGHGGHDNGGSSGYVYEKHLALDTARRLEVLLRNNGLKVIMARSRDNFVSLPGRAAIGNRYKNAIFVSIHYNWASRSSAAGAETFYYRSDSLPLATYIQRYMVRKAGIPSRGVKSASFHVLRNTYRNPAALVECGFVSNASERNRCMKGSHRQRLAEGIAEGILAYKQVFR